MYCSSRAGGTLANSAGGDARRASLRLSFRLSITGSRIAREQRMTVILSSHQLHQVQRICDRVGILAKGQMVIEGVLEELGREALGDGQYRVEVRLAEVTPALVDCIKRLDGVVNVERSENLLLVSCSEDLRPQIAKVIVDNNGLLEEVKIQSYTLEDIYMKYFREA
ncbi:hypothetical protein ES703_63004 [subsurface metagenome]